MNYFIKSGEREKGPYSLEVLQNSLRDGAFKPTTLVRAEDEDEWVPMAAIANLEAPAPARRSAKGGADEAKGQAQTRQNKKSRDESDYERGLDWDVQARMRRDRNQKDGFIGALICFAGILVTVVSYSSASAGGGRYVFAWGAIIFGGIRMVRGMTS